MTDELLHKAIQMEESMQALLKLSTVLQQNLSVKIETPNMRWQLEGTPEIYNAFKDFVDAQLAITAKQFKEL